MDGHMCVHVAANNSDFTERKNSTSGQKGKMFYIFFSFVCGLQMSSLFGASAAQMASHMQSTGVL